MAKKKEKIGTQSLTCEWRSQCADTQDGKNKNKIYRHKGACIWSGTRTERYKQKDGEWSDISRNVLIGNSGESAKFHLRYFEIAAGGFSSLEKHSHEHVVICIKGKGKVVTGEKSHVIKYLDTLYIAPNTVHQLSNPYGGPFGFFCIVNADRDKPKLIKK
jgi:ribulose-bisphosphate carboxylase large chain